MTLVRFAHRFVKERVYYARSQLNVANFTHDASSCIYINGNIVGNDIKMFDVRDKLKPSVSVVFGRATVRSSYANLMVLIRHCLRWMQLLTCKSES